MTQLASPSTLDPAVVDRVRDHFRADPSQMTMLTAKALGIAEKTVLQALSGDWPIVPLRDGCFQEIMRALPDFGVLRVFVRSRAAVIEAVGEFGGYSETGPFFNVQTETIDMHLIPAEISAIFAVEKKGHDSDYSTHSFQFFDRQGDAGFKVFLWDGFPKVPQSKIDLFHGVVDRLKAS